MFVRGFVPDENIGEGGDNEINEKTEDPSDQEKTGELTIDVIPRPGTEIGIFGRFQVQKMSRRLIDKRLRRAEESKRTVGGIGESRQGDGGG